jgi:hypothetical protein
MKKFCSKCGNQLDLGKKSCTVCQAFNPYFISGFTNNEPVAKVELQEELLIAKEQTIANEAALRAEQLEREKNEQSIKSELLRVKEETEQYKKETLNLVAGVQKELHDMDRQNKLLKETVQSLKNARLADETEVVTPTSLSELKSTEPRSSATYVIVAAVVLGIGVMGYSYFYFSKSLKSSSPVVNTQAPVVTQPPAAQVSPKSTHDVATDTISKHVWLAAAAPSPKPNNVSFTLTATRVIGDLVGKKLSGCDITINSPSEISHIDNLVLVEKLSASYFKYKCTVKVKQGTETYTASPYIYYSAEGSFIKVDGTNCE